MSYENDVKRLLRNGNDLHLVAGLASEAGEVAALYQKAAYMGSNIVDVAKLKLELGDVLFYVTALANSAGLTIKQLQDANIEKLEQRLANRERQYQGEADGRL